MANMANSVFFLAHFLVLFHMIHGKVPAIIVFGDSTVDAGNNNQISTVLKSNFGPYGRDFFGGEPTGRFSNGRIATDFISEAFGIKPSIPAYLDPNYSIKDFATGVCFASAGTGYDNATSDVLSVIPLWKEVEYYQQYQKELRGYLGEEKANEVISEALHLISIGTNDFLENYYLIPDGRSKEFSAEEYQDFLVKIAGNFLTELYRLGARKISISGLPPMGCLPLERVINFFSVGDCKEEYNDVAKQFNVKLQVLITELNQRHAGLRLVLTNPYDIVYEMIQNPSSFGFEYVAVACCGTGLFEMGYLCDNLSPLTCSDADKYLFWDSFHPTEKTNRIVAKEALKTNLAQFLH
ncbi:hypothetical protein UlMin_003703 [Ulmus minor]